MENFLKHAKKRTGNQESSDIKAKRKNKEEEGEVLEMTRGG